VTERLSDIIERIDNMHQLDAVVTVMRGIAAARTQQSRGLLAGIEAYTETISAAIGQALNLLPEIARPRAALPPTRALILFCAEQGFAGGFSDRVLDAAAKAGDLRAASLMMIGSRGVSVAAERGLKPAWTTAMANQIGTVPEVANRIADALYVQFAKGALVAVDIVFARLDGDRTIRAEHSRLLPLDYERFATAAAAIPPLITLGPDRLLAQLAEEYIYARLCEAAMHSFAAENEARLQAMSAASDNIDKTLAELTEREHRVRQEDVTAEIIELAAGVEAQRTG
jgi:F-type H+-transporting ATPase subunit gamma